MNEIQQWFNKGCDYDSGVLIYKNHPKHKKNIARLLSKRNNVRNQEKLKYELKKFSDTPVRTIAKPVTVVKLKFEEDVKLITKASTISAQQKQAVFFHQLPEALQPVLLEANVLFKECCLLKVQLNRLPSKSEKKALDLQLQISDKRKANELCWTKIDYWLDHKKLLKEPECEFDNLTPAQLWKKDQYLYQSKGKLEKRILINKEKLLTTTSVDEKNRLKRAIAKQEANLIKQQSQHLKIKEIINGR